MTIGYALAADHRDRATQFATQSRAQRASCTEGCSRLLLGTVAASDEGGQSHACSSSVIRAA
jgi:hypothetical protein